MKAEGIRYHRCSGAADEVLDGAYVAYRGKPGSSEAKTWGTDERWSRGEGFGRGLYRDITGHSK
jgi:hypothetical protein